MSRGVVRKRKRSAVDPCLGYYAEREAGDGVQLPNPLVVDNQHTLENSPRIQLSPSQAAKPLSRRAPYLPENAAVSDSGDAQASITVDDFLRRKAASSLRPGERCGEAGKTRLKSFVQLDDGHRLPSEESPLRSAAPKFSPIEFEVSPFRPKSAVDWAFDVKAPPTPGTTFGEDEPEELALGSDLLSKIAVLDSNCSSGRLEPLPSPEKKTLRLRTRSIPRRLVEDNSASESEMDTGSDFLKLTPEAKRPRRRGKSKKVHFKSLGTRLFEACVATRGDPLDSLVVPPQATKEAFAKDDVEPERKPLPFIPVNDSPGTTVSGPLVSARRYTLVDPHRIEPFRTAFFGPPMTAPGQTLSQAITPEVRQPLAVYKSLSNWRPKLDENCFQETPSRKRVSTRRKCGLRKEGENPPEIAYAPLQFVPLSDAPSRKKDSKGHRVLLENRRA
ncbi:hypothetical protein NMY22_g2237 [Coprinellus aureogranulatus]|nr:hypothetical protein NMY22_g2237 [Coprinellus aureogranulatus]